MTYPKIAQKIVHEVVAVRLAALSHRASDVADKANSHRAETRLFLVGQGVVEERREGIHVLDKVFLHRVGKTADSGEHRFRNARFAINSAEDL